MERFSELNGEMEEKNLKSTEKKMTTLKAREQRLRRLIEKQQKEINASKKETHKWKIRYYRLKNKHESPILKKVKEIEKCNKSVIRKKLIEGEVLKEHLETKKRQLSHKEKIMFNQFMAGRILRKYKLMTHFSNLVSTRMQNKYCQLKSFFFQSKTR